MPKQPLVEKANKILFFFFLINPVATCNKQAPLRKKRWGIKMQIPQCSCCNTHLGESFQSLALFFLPSNGPWIKLPILPTIHPQGNPEPARTLGFYFLTVICMKLCAV